jgi:hypothetical protein
MGSLPALREAEDARVQQATTHSARGQCYQARRAAQAEQERLV